MSLVCPCKFPYKFPFNLSLKDNFKTLATVWLQCRGRFAVHNAALPVPAIYVSRFGEFIIPDC